MHPTDSPALLDFRQASDRGEACTLATALKGGPGRFPVVNYASTAFSPRAWQNCWVKTRRARIQAIAKAGRRSGPTAWEVSDLYTRRDCVGEAWDVLEQLSIPAGRSGARRLFLRVQSSSPYFEQARRAGYMPVVSETVYRTVDAQAALESLGEPTKPLTFRARTSEDLHDLYRLYSSSTPLGVRTHSGQTMSEWSDSLERPPAKSQDWVIDDERGGIGAWLRTADGNFGRWFSIMWSRDFAAYLPGLVAAALADTDAGRAAISMVPAHNAPLAELLESIGFEQAGQYDVLVRILAEQVTETRGAVVVTG